MKASILSGVVLSEVCGENLLIATGDARGKVPYVLSLNETATFIWKLLEKGADGEEIKAALCREYEIDEKTACAAHDSFMHKLLAQGYIVQ